MQDIVEKDAGDGRAAPRRHGVQAIARAGRVMRALQVAPEGLTLQELAREVALPKSTVHRLVGALAQEDLVSTGRRIRLGGGLERLAAAARHTLSLDVRPALEDLRGQLQETVDLAVLDGNEMRFLDQLPAGHRLRAVSSVGARFPLHCTANGKALLAALPEEQVLALLPAQLERMTPNTIATRRELLVELDRIGSAGVAFDHEEHTQGICAVGACVLDAHGPVAAISVPVPTPRFRGHEEHCAAAVALAAEQASRLLAGASAR